MSFAILEVPDFLEKTKIYLSLLASFSFISIKVSIESKDSVEFYLVVLKLEDVVKNLRTFSKGISIVFSVLIY